MPLTTIHPFQLNDKTIGDENSDPAQYRFGAMAAVVAKHWREKDERDKGNYSSWSSWYDDLEDAEEGLLEHAAEIMGERVQLHEAYI